MVRCFEKCVRSRKWPPNNGSHEASRGVYPPSLGGFSYSPAGSIYIHIQRFTLGAGRLPKTRVLPLFCGGGKTILVVSCRSPCAPGSTCPGPSRSGRHHGPGLAKRKWKTVYFLTAENIFPFPLALVCTLCPEPFVIGTTRSLNEPYAPSLLVVGVLWVKEG